MQIITSQNALNDFEVRFTSQLIQALFVKYFWFLLILHYAFNKVSEQKASSFSLKMIL